MSPVSLVRYFCFLLLLLWHMYFKLLAEAFLGRRPQDGQSAPARFILASAWVVFPHTNCGFPGPWGTPGSFWPALACLGAVSRSGVLPWAAGCCGPPHYLGASRAHPVAVGLPVVGHSLPGALGAMWGCPGPPLPVPGLCIWAGPWPPRGMGGPLRGPPALCCGAGPVTAGHCWGLGVAPGASAAAGPSVQSFPFLRSRDEEGAAVPSLSPEC